MAESEAHVKWPRLAALAAVRSICLVFSVPAGFEWVCSALLGKETTLWKENPLDYRAGAQTVTVRTPPFQLHAWLFLFLSVAAAV